MGKVLSKSNLLLLTGIFLSVTGCNLLGLSENHTTTRRFPIETKNIEEEKIPHHKWKYLLPEKYGQIIEMFAATDDKLILVSETVAVPDITNGMTFQDLEETEGNYKIWLHGFSYAEHRLSWSLQCGSTDKCSFINVSGHEIVVGGYHNNLRAISIDNGEVVWEKNIPRYWNGGLFVQKNLIVIATCEMGFFALDARSGELAWKTSVKFKKYESWEECGMNSGFFSDVVFFENRLVFGNRLGEIHCLATEDGSVLWKRNIGTDANGPIVIWENNIYLGTVEGEIVVMDVDTGGIRKALKFADENVRCLERMGHDIYGFSGESHVFSFNANTFESNWNHATGFTGVKDCSHGFRLINGKLWKLPEVRSSPSIVAFDVETGLPALEISDPDLESTSIVGIGNKVLISIGNQILGF